MKAFWTAMMLMLLTGTAFAQAINLITPKIPQTAEERAREKAIEDAYKEKMGKIPDQKASSDPWGDVRTAPQKTTTPARKATGH